MAYSNRPQSLDRLLRQYMKRIPGKTEFRRGMVLHLWPEVVGAQVASVTRKLSFERERLIVTVQNEVWRHELHQSRHAICNKLNGRVGSDVVKEIVVRC